MTQLNPQDRWPEGDIKILWTEEIDRPITGADVLRLEDELGLQLYGISDPLEHSLGGRLVDPTREQMRELIANKSSLRIGNAVLRASRRHGEGKDFLTSLPGLVLDLVSTINADESSRWGELRVQCVGVLTGLGLVPPVSGEGLFLAGNDRE